MAEEPTSAPPAARHRRAGRFGRHALVAAAGMVCALGLTGAMTPGPGPSDSLSQAVQPGPLKASVTQDPGRASRDARIVSGPAWTKALPATTTQAVRTVRTNRWCSQIWCTRTEVWERVDTDAGRTWRIVTRTNGEKAVFRSQIGQNGFAPVGKRRQGDMRTPTGAYGIATTFSTTSERPTEMPWRRRLPTSVVSDAYGKAYNTWVELKGNGSGDRRMMSWGLWIDYNNPRLEVGQGAKPIPGRGSGIFMHTSNAGAPFVPTAGCVQLGDPADMAWIVRWLSPEANPRIVNNR